MRFDNEIGTITRFVVTFVEYGESVDGKARLLDLFDTRKEAVAEMHAAARKYKDDLGLDAIELYDDSASVGDIGECGCEYRIDEVKIPVYEGELDADSGERNEDGDNVLRATIEIPVNEIRKWNGILSADRLDYDALGFKPNDVVARWTARFPDGRFADITVDTGEKDHECYAEATLFDSDGSQVAFTPEASYTLDWGEWLLWAGKNEYRINVIAKEKNESKEPEDRKEA